MTLEAPWTGSDWREYSYGGFGGGRRPRFQLARDRERERPRARVARLKASYELRLTAARAEAGTAHKSPAKPRRPPHDYQSCADKDCQRPVCVAFGEGYKAGHQDGDRQGFERGWDRGYHPDPGRRPHHTAADPLPEDLRDAVDAIDSKRVRTSLAEVRKVCELVYEFIRKGVGFPLAPDG